MTIFKKKAAEVDHLRKLQLEAIEDAGYWFCQGNYEQYARSAAQAMDINQQLIQRRRKLF